MAQEHLHPAYNEKEQCKTGDSSHSVHVHSAFINTVWSFGQLSLDNSCCSCFPVPPPSLYTECIFLLVSVIQFWRECVSAWWVLFFVCLVLYSSPVLILAIPLTLPARTLSLHTCPSSQVLLSSTRSINECALIQYQGIISVL